MQYCISTWGTASNSSLDPLEKLHMRIIRIITFSDYQAHITPLFHKLQLLKIKGTFKLEIAKKMFCYKNNEILHSADSIPSIQVL